MNLKLFMLLSIFGALPGINAQIGIGLERVDEADSQENDAFLSELSVNLLTNSRNVYYVGLVRLGTPPQLFKMMFDTGSSQLAVFSSKCWTSLNCWLKRTYQSGKSSTYTTTGDTISINYADSSIRGVISSDNLTLNDVSLEVDFCEIISTEFFKFTEHYEGIFGLGFIEMASNGLTPPFYKFLPILPFPGFSLYLARNSKGKGNGGELLFGGVDFSKFIAGSLNIHRVIDWGRRWALKLDRIQVGKRIIVDCPNGCTAILDTGTSHIVGPGSDVADIRRVSGADSNGRIDCNSINTLPKIRFTIDNKPYILGPLNYASKHSFLWMRRCHDSLSTHPHNYWILGDVFIANYYTVWNVKNKTIGIGKLCSKNKLVV